MHLAKWITNNTKRPFYGRKEISIDKDIYKATAYVCGLGQFNFYINGEKVEDHILDPGWTNYDKIVQYVKFDVTKNLVKGRNVIGGEVGNGWFIMEGDGYIFHFPPFMPPNPNPYKPYGESLVFNMILDIEYTDGSKGQICSDESFKVSPHYVTMSNIYGSETIDGRLIQENWSSAQFDDSNWTNAEVAEEPKGELQEQTQPPIKVIKTYEGAFMHSVNGRDIFDFSQNMSGIFALEVKGKRGDKIEIFPGEKLSDDGDADQMAKNWLEINSCITYIIGKDDTWEKAEMKFTYFAGRYAAVKFTSVSGEKKPEIRNFKAHAISSAYVQSGSFSCDDKRYEQIYDLVEKAVEANMLSVHTDCPTIERFAWQEPNHLMAPSIMFMKDGDSLWRKFLTDLRYDQHTETDFFYDMQGNKIPAGDGLIPSQSPCYIPNFLPVPNMGSFYDIIPWGSTIILGTYWHYMFYGDKEIIKENYQAGMRYLNYLKTKINDDGFINHGLGDWGNPKEGMLARENVETAFLYADAVTLASFAESLELEKDANELYEFAEQIKVNYNKKLLIKYKDFYCYRTWEYQDKTVLTQASQALPLYWGMVPEEHIDDVVKALRYTIQEEGSFICGEVGQPYVIQTMRKYGMNKEISRLILKETHPSYYAFILDGETTLGEYWETNPRSHCHDMMGHIVEWYYNGIAGIIVNEPGFKNIVIKPYLPETIRSFSCKFKSASGEISISIVERENDILVKLHVDKGICYTFDDELLSEKGKSVALKITE